jgi:hypothetical protein
MARRRVWRPQSRLTGCLLWLLVLIVVLIALSVMFGGFQKGTKVNGQGRLEIGRTVGTSRWCDAPCGQPGTADSA